MPRPTSLSLRLTLMFGLAAAIVLSGFGWFIGRSIDHHFRIGDTVELEVIAEAVAQLLADRKALADRATLEQRFNDILASHHNAALHVTDERGRVLFSRPAIPNLPRVTLAAADRDALNQVRLWRSAGHTYRLLTRRLAISDTAAPGTYFMSVALTIDYHLRFLDSFHHSMWLMVVGGIVIMALIGWIAVRQGHAPLHHIVDQIRRITSDELNTRLDPATVPKELTELALSFNEMLARMERAFSRLSNFSADIAHELRTPITNLLTQTQVALSQSRTIDEYREILYSNIEEYERMAQMIGDMLFLAKADYGLYQPETTKVRLGEEIQALFDYYEAWAEERGVRLALSGDAEIPGDRAMLRRALGNLLSNAIRHTEREKTVAVRIAQSVTGGIEVVVENPGADIPAHHLPRLFDRFYRADGSRQRDGEGAGLGLAITKSIIDIHGGRIAVNSAGGVTRFTVTLPH